MADFGGLPIGDAEDVGFSSEQFGKISETMARGR